MAVSGRPATIFCQLAPPFLVRNTYGWVSCGTISAAYAVAASCRPASTISNVPFAGASGGDTSFHRAPSSPVIWITPLFVPAQITPALNAESDRLVIDAVGGLGEDAGAGARAGTSVRSGLTSVHVMPPSSDFTTNCV